MNSSKNKLNSKITGKIKQCQTHTKKKKKKSELK